MFHHYWAPICYVALIVPDQPVITTSEHFSTTDDEEPASFRPGWLSLPPRSAQQMSTKSSHPDASAMAPAPPMNVFIAAEEEEEDPNHAWLEQQMMYESDDDELFNL